MKKILCVLLACAMAIGLMAMPAGASGSSPGSTAHADRLASLGLFRGTASGYDLDKTPSRLQGLIMLIRLLGKEEEALASNDPNPFTDVGGGGVRYAAYGAAHGLAGGTGPGTFSPSQPLRASHYVIFLLRALGYNDGRGDFTVGSHMDFAAKIGLMTSEAAAKLPAVSMDRGDLVDLSYAALTCKLNGGSRTLAEKLRDEGVFTTAAGEAAGVLGRDAGWVYTYDGDRTPATPSVPSAPSGGGVRYEVKTVSTSGGNVSAKVLTVDTKDPKVRVKSAMVDGRLGATAPFSDIVSSSGGALAVVNGNFFESYAPFQVPIGHVMVDGQFLYGNSGLTSLGITGDGELRVGRPALFTRIVSSDGSSWAAYEINTKALGGSVLYTPAYGETVTLDSGGSVLTAAGGKIVSFQSVGAGTAVTIPRDGFLCYMDGGFTSTNYFRTPAAGASVSLEYFLQREDPEGFTLDGVTSVISGAPRLVQDGAIVTALEPGFTEARFTSSVTPRTAVGVNGQGRLVIVSVPAASIQQMRELMLSLGCVDAFNLDGGASCAMYYDGSYVATPGRQLTVTLQVFQDP